LRTVLVTGVNGLLGSNLLNTLKEKQYLKIIGTGLNPKSSELSREVIQGDLLDTKFVSDLFAQVKPDAVINTVALPNLEKCERNTEIAHDLNVETAVNVAKAVSRTSCRMVHISTDQLFQGDKAFYTEEDEPNPVNCYGVGCVCVVCNMLCGLCVVCVCGLWYVCDVFVYVCVWCVM